MANLINWSLVCRRSLYDQLSDHVRDVKTNDLIELEKINNQVAFKAHLIKTNIEHQRFDEKLIYVDQIYELKNDQLEDCVTVLRKIDRLDGVTDVSKLKMLISYVSIAHLFDDLVYLNDNTIFMLALAASIMDVNDYPHYIDILSNNKLARTITKESYTFDDQLKLIENVISLSKVENKQSNQNKLVKTLVKSVYEFKDNKRMQMAYRTR